MLQTFAEKPFRWIDLFDPEPEELKEISTAFNLHPASLNDCLQPDHLPKYEVIDDVHFIIIRVFENTAPRESSTVQQFSNKVAMFFNKDFLITIHRSDYPWLEDVKKQYLDSDRVKNTFDLSAKIIKVGLRSFEEPANIISREIDFYESRVFLRKRVPDLLKGMYHLKRKAAIGERILFLSKVAITELERAGKARSHVIQDLKDHYVHIHSNYLQLIDKLNNLLTIYLSVSSQRTNEVMRVLTVFSAFFLPLTFIVGVYGMNFAHMPELEWIWGYPAVIATMLFVTLVIFQWFKRKGWL